MVKRDNRGHKMVESPKNISTFKFSLHFALNFYFCLKELNLMSGPKFIPKICFV